MKKDFIKGYRLGKPGLEKVLGSLESEVMEVIWATESTVSVRDVLDTLNIKRDLAYTTVMTIMGRLAEKKLLTKHKEGNAFFFKPVLTREEFTRQMVAGLIDDLLVNYSEAAFSHFMQRVGEKDRAVLEKLEKTLAELKEQKDDYTT